MGTRIYYFTGTGNSLWAPKEAIQLSGKTRGERRYHHPSVKTSDIVAQKRTSVARAPE